tara:strand:- start:506 stop:1126 length:621 start_codon:yes stop_codon:yes gene_type:complete
MTINTKKFFNENDPSTYHLPVKDTRFNPSLMDMMYKYTEYTETNGDRNTISGARFMGGEELRGELSKTYKDMGMEMEGSGYLPNVGKAYIDTAAGIVGGIDELNKDGNTFDKVLMSQTGMNRDDAAFAINSQLEGTDAHYMSQLSKSINLRSDLAQGKITTVIQPVVNNVQVPTPVPQPTPVPVKGKTNTVFLDASNNNTLAKLIR